MSQNQINFTVEQVEKLLAMQDQLNSYIHPEWKKQNFDWNFAIIDECREIKEHLGWKWWKENYQCGLTEQNRKQVQLEVIDILHFVLSISAENDSGASSICNWFNNGNSCYLEGVDKATKSLLEEAACQGMAIWEYWTSLAVQVDLTTEQVIETYIQKFVLNKFRQDHGYRDGSYCKEWKFRHYVGDDLLPIYMEDNEALAEVVEELKSDELDATDETALYTALEAMYNSRLNK